MRFVLLLFMFAVQAAFPQTPIPVGPKPLFSDDPKGSKLPPGVPRMVDTNGNVVWIDHSFTTRRYQQAAFKLLLQEANRVAKELQLPGECPIIESNLVEAVVTPFGFNYVNRTIGSITTKNYCYYISQGNKFSYLENTHQTQDCFKFQDSYTWSVNRMNTNQAFRLAAHFLTAVSMDVNTMNRDCNVVIEVDTAYVHSPAGEFVPIYDVYWRRRDYASNNVESAIRADVASVRVFTPTKALLSLHVEDAQYIHRKPLIVTNLNSLFPGKAPVYILPPAKIAPQPGPG